jgi:hypothetical protein
LNIIRKLPGSLDVGADSFIELRYLYEKQSSHFLLADFEVLAYPERRIPSLKAALSGEV